MFFRDIIIIKHSSEVKKVEIYSTAEVAKQFNLHPNTIRFYEKMGLMPKIDRKENGYRIFTKRHILQVELIKAGFQSEILASSLRKQVLEIIKVVANEEYELAEVLIKTYQENLEQEERHAKEAIVITEQLLKTDIRAEDTVLFNNRQAAADYLGITKNVLREWERSGLLNVARDVRGYHLYRLQDIQRAKIIRTLRSAHYSMMAVLRMLNAIQCDEKIDIMSVIDTPMEEDIVYVTDRFITALGQAKNDVKKMKAILQEIKIR